MDHRRERAETIKLMNANYGRFLGFTVDRAAIQAWNEYSIRNELIREPVPADQVISDLAPAP